jgi:hypothetical protein
MLFQFSSRDAILNIIFFFCQEKLSNNNNYVLTMQDSMFYICCPLAHLPPGFKGNLSFRVHVVEDVPENICQFVRCRKGKSQNLKASI